MSEDPFATAGEAKEEAGSDFAQFKDFVGELVLIIPKKYEEEVESKFANPNKGGRKVQDRITADCVVLDTKAPADSVKHDGVWINYGRIIKVTKGKVNGGMVLGRVVTEDLAGGNTAYDLEDPTDAEKQVARDYIDATAPQF